MLEAFSQNGAALSLAEIAAIVELDKSSVFRIVYTLEQLDYLERDQDTKRYRPGLEVLKLGFSALHRLDIVQLSRPYLEALQQETQESVSMAIRDGADIVYIARFAPVQILNINLQVGSRLPLHCTAMGKALLSALSPAEVAELLGPDPYRACTPKTKTTLDDLLADVERARARGFAISDQELSTGVRSAAALIRREHGEVAASIDVSALTADTTPEELVDRLAPMLTRTAARISRALGAAEAM